MAVEADNTPLADSQSRAYASYLSEKISALKSGLDAAIAGGNHQTAEEIHATLIEKEHQLRHLVIAGFEFESVEDRERRWIALSWLD